MSNSYLRGDDHIAFLKGTVKSLLDLLEQAVKQGMVMGKTEVVNFAFGKGNYAYGIGVINTLIMLGYLEEYDNGEIRYIHVTPKGVEYVSE